MLRLWRLHVKFGDEYVNKAEIKLEWAIGDFKSFYHINKYLNSYHNYEIFDYKDRELVFNKLDDIGFCYLPVFTAEILEDGTEVRYMVEKLV